jgi:hypothetical protein
MIGVRNESMDDAQLLRQYGINHDLHTFDQIVEKYYRLVYRTAYTRTNGYSEKSHH